MLLSLSHSYSEADLWVALPPQRREMAHDYHAQDRLQAGLRSRLPALSSGLALVGQLHGMQDTYFPRAAQVPAGWEVSCTCGRRMPCAHVGALLWAWVGDPERFQHYDRVRDFLLETVDDPLWAWAAGAPFPWDRVRALPWYCRPASQETVQPFFAAKDAWSTRHRELRHAVSLAHPSWWDRTDWETGLAEALGALADGTPGDQRVEELSRWVGTAAAEPRLDLAPLLATCPAHPSIPAELMAQLWTLAGRHGLEPRPSYRLRACALLRYLSLWYRRFGNPEDIAPLWDRWAWADPQGIAEADFWAAEGDVGSALAALHKRGAKPATASYEWRLRHQAWSRPPASEGPVPPPE